ncbi:hypothetical protein BDR04DRAFT_1142977 [Suillus decipiens]|nr:hypothetical protein BDR04DRAFT_1142977 [Suillus decipiens]
MTDAPNACVVPDALSLTKSQKKKCRSNKPKIADSPAEGPVIIPDATSVVLVDRTPEEADAKESTFAPDLVTPSEDPTFEDMTSKSSPVVELLQKRLKLLNKKISRIMNYATTDHAKLNDDQKRSLKTLSSLEAVQKELEDLKKSIEVRIISSLTIDKIINPFLVVELLQKRLKPLNKKISRITSYATTNHEKLNNDQKRSLKTLSSLKAVQKELEDIKKSIEIHEANPARETAARHVDTDLFSTLEWAMPEASLSTNNKDLEANYLRLARLTAIAKHISHLCLGVCALPFKKVMTASKHHRLLILCTLHLICLPLLCFFPPLRLLVFFVVFVFSLVCITL